MEKLEPTTADVYFVYVCPGCGAQHVKERAETVFPGRELCTCGRKLWFRPIQSVEVRPIYETSKKTTKLPTKEKKSTKLPTKEKKQLTKVEDEAIMGLVAIGFKKKQAVMYVEEHDFDTVEDYIKGACSNV